MTIIDQFKFLGIKMTIPDKWFAKVCESYLAPPAFYKGEKLPAFPDDTVQENTTGQSGINTLKDAFTFYTYCIETFKQLGAPLKPKHFLLDFGVGWGRIARFFLKELPLNHLYGIDVMAEFVQICQDSFLNENFMVCDPYPPTSIADGKFDFIVGCSVFSHLSEDACLMWMREFHRILSAGGIVALTTRGRWFFDFCEDLKGKAASGYLYELSCLFDDFSAARSDYDSGRFVHSNRHGVTGGGVLTADFYGESFIPEVYARHAYKDYFVLKRFLNPPSHHSHPIMFFRKK
jgi:SAM-dependent methyltransferase